MTDPKAPQPPIDWAAIASEVTQYGRDVVEHVGQQLQTRAHDAQNHDITVDKLLDDVKSFWLAVAGDVDRGIENWKTYVEHRGDGA